MAENLLSSDVFKSVLDTVSNLLDMLNNIDTSGILAIGAVFLMVGKTIVKNLISTISSGIKSMASIGQKMGQRINEGLTSVVTKGADKVWNSIFTKLGKQKVSFTLDTQEAQRQIDEIKQKFSSSTTGIQTRIDFDTTAGQQKLQDIVVKLKNITNEEGNISNQQAFKQLASEANLTEDQLREIANVMNQLKQEGIDLEAVLGGSINATAQINRNQQIVSQTLSSCVLSATTFATALLGGASAADALKTYLVTTLTTVLPQIISIIAKEVVAQRAVTAQVQQQTIWQAICTALKSEELLLTLAIVAAVALLVAAIAGIVTLVKKIDSYSTTSRISDLTDQVDSLSESISTAKSELKELNEETESLEDIQDTYEELAGKSILSDEEQERWDDMISTLESDYPELIGYYNEETGQLQLQNTLLQEKIDLLNEETDIAQQTLASQQLQLVNTENELETLETSQDLSTTLGLTGWDSKYFDEAELEAFSQGEVEVKVTTDFWSGEKQVVLAAETEDYGTESIGIEQDEIEDVLKKYYSEDYYQTNFEGKSDTYLAETAADLYETAYQNLKNGYYEGVEGESDEFVAAVNEMIESINSAAVAAENVSFDFYELYDSVATLIETLYPDVSDTEQLVYTAIADAQIDANNDEVSFERKALKGRKDEFGATFDDANLTDEQEDMAEEIENAAYKAYKDVSDGWSSQAWDELSSTTRETLEKIGITEDIYKDDDVENMSNTEAADYIGDKLEGYLSTIIGETVAGTEGIEQLVGNTEDLIENPEDYDKNEFDALYSEMQQQVMATLGYEGEYDDLTDEEQKIVIAALDAMYNFSGTQDAYSSLEGFLGEGSVDWMDPETAQQYASIVANITDDYEEDSKTAKEIVETYTEGVENLTVAGKELSDQQISTFLNLDVTSFEDQDYDTILDTVIAAMDASGNFDDLGEDEAKEWAEAYMGTLKKSGLVDFTIKTLSGVEDSLDTLFEGMEDNLDSITGAVEEMINSITDEDYNTGDLYEYLQELNEAGDFDWTDLDDWVELDENGEIQLKITGGEIVEKQVAGVLDDLEDSYNNIMEGTRDGIIELEEEIKNLKKIIEAFSNGNIDFESSYTVQEFADAAKISPEEAAQLLADSGATDTILDTDSETTFTITQDVYNYFDNALTTDESSIGNLRDWYNGEQDTGTLKAFLEQVGTDEALSQLYDMQDEYQDAVDDALEDVKDAEESVADAEESLADAEEKLADALEDYSELLYGSDNRASTLDNLYNYTEAINSYTNAASRAEDELGDATTIEEATQAWQDYASAYHNVIAYTEAESQVIEEALANYSDWIENATSSYTDTENGNTITINYSDYVTYDENTGKYVLDQQLLNQAEFNDDYKELLETQVENYNKYSEELLSLEEQQKEAEEALQEARKQAYQDYASMEEEIASVLQEQYQDEIDALEEKYEAMEEADSDYLDALKDAIDKQRELRDQENEYEDLAQQERKLALMQRDTSGANQTEVMELEDEVEESRQDLLDEEVDNILDNMEEMNDNISELHETEIELKQAILDNTAYWNSQAETIAASFTSAEDYVAWMTENSTEFIESTMTEQIVLMDEWTDTATAALTKYAIDGSDTIENYVTVTTDEVSTIINTTGEALTTEVTRQANETTEQVTEDLESAINSIDDARQSVADAEEALSDANLALSNAQSNLSDATTNLDTFNSKLQDTIDLIEGFEITSDNDDSSSGGTSTHSSGTHIDQSYTGSSSDSDSDKSTDLLSPVNNDGTQKRYRTQTNTGAYYYSDSLSALELVSGTGTYWDIEDNKPSNTGISSDELTWEKLEEEGILSNKTSKYWFQKYIVAHKFATGGLVDYTGPAWVDGTPSSPEAFLSAEDTERIGRAAEILADLPLLNSTSSTDNINSTSYGDTTIEINLNIDSLSSDVDVDNMIELMKQEIVDAANPVGSSNILIKSY